jgi:hypothetical protein
MLRGHPRFGEFHRVIWREAVGERRNPKEDSAMTVLARLRTRCKGVAPTGLSRFLPFTPGLRPGLIYAVPAGLVFMRHSSSGLYMHRGVHVLIRASGIQISGSFMHCASTLRAFLLRAFMLRLIQSGSFFASGPFNRGDVVIVTVMLRQSHPSYHCL